MKRNDKTYFVTLESDGGQEKTVRTRQIIKRKRTKSEQIQQPKIITLRTSKWCL